MKIIKTILILLIYQSCSHFKSSKIDSTRSPSSDKCNTLTQKLEHQFDKYDDLNKKISLGNSHLSRPEWEKMIQPDQECILTNKDVSQLIENQNDIINLAKEKNKKNSNIDIEAIRARGDTKQFCESFPKGGVLHLHPSGVLDEETLKDLGVSNTSAFFLSGRQYSFNEFDRVFSPLRSVLGSGLSKNLKYAIKKYLHRAKKENVIYVEFSKLFDPSIDNEINLSRWKEEFFKETGIIVNWKNGFIRVFNDWTNQKQLEQLVEAEYQYRRRFTKDKMDTIVGIDLYGDEENSPMLEKGQYVYSRLKSMYNNTHPKGWTTKIKMSAHAGESGDARNPRDAMILGVDRIGHGLALKDRPIELEYARNYNSKNGLPIEINIHSNYILSNIENYKAHPFLSFLRLGLPVSLSTDDEGIFKSTISTECEIAINNTDINYYELKQMSYNSIKTSFANESEKTILLKTLSQNFQDFESEWDR